mmetsp:Transcript_4797/g.8333  ORF Transcript_4797/g.8333 Transcript_4797/m.8333 type:complete len:114 (+) Transcript_4797:376-717(+)
MTAMRLGTAAPTMCVSTPYALKPNYDHLHSIMTSLTSVQSSNVTVHQCGRRTGSYISAPWCTKTRLGAVTQLPATPRFELIPKGTEPWGWYLPAIACLLILSQKTRLSLPETQ